MADNATPPATTDTFAFDDIGGVKFARTKLTHGADGTNDGDVSSANPLPVVQTGTHNVTVNAALPAGTNNIGDVDILSIAAGDNNIGNVDVVTLPALPAGTNNIGDVDVVSLPRSATPSQSSVNDSASSVTVLASNANRLGATVFNDSTQILYLKLGATASTTSFTVKLFPDDLYEAPFGYTGVIDGIWAADASGAARVTEFTA